MQPLPEIPKLPTRSECVIFVDYHDLDKLIKRVYGIFETSIAYSVGGGILGFRDFTVVGMEEWTNDSVHEYTVEKKPLDKWDKRDLAEFMDNPFVASYALNVLLQDLCNNGYIGPGTYIISVSW